jgi:hypothetical protein
MCAVGQALIASYSGTQVSYDETLSLRISSSLRFREMYCSHLQCSSGPTSNPSDPRAAPHCRTHELTNKV